MGLDVSVYRNVKVTKDEEDYDFEAFVIDKSWEYKINNLKKDAIYIGEICEAQTGYSYSSHYHFRKELLRLTSNNNFISGDDIDFDTLDGNADIPFYELINFADNEGCLDWEISEKLYHQFELYKDVAKEYFKDKKWYNKYLEWMEIFKEGKNINSVVVFH